MLYWTVCFRSVTVITNCGNVNTYLYIVKVAENSAGSPYTKNLIRERNEESSIKFIKCCGKYYNM